MYINSHRNKKYLYEDLALTFRALLIICCVFRDIDLYSIYCFKINSIYSYNSIYKTNVTFKLS